MDLDSAKNAIEKELNIIKSMIFLDNLKSKYILSKILDNLSKNKSLEIIKYNKKIQNRLNLSIKDYKEFYEHIPIEIELIPLKNKLGNFISRLNKNEEAYFHIFFNDKKE